MNRESSLSEVLARSWPLILEHIGAAVIVLDRERAIAFISERACQLLGYRSDEVVGRRCRLTTRGLDCGTACPLTYALDSGREVVEGFRAVYQTRDGKPVPLEVTVIPARDGEGEFVGAVEILSPTQPDPGFFLAGTSATASELRQRLSELASSDSHVLLIGDPDACGDVARAVHRFGGLAEDLFVSWPGSWEEVTPWPPGTLFAQGDEVEEALSVEAPPGWRVVAARGSAAGFDAGYAERLAVVRLPELEELREDLPLMIAAWVELQAPGCRVAAQALERLCRMALDRGLGCVREALIQAVAVADGRIEAAHLPTECYATALVDELLKEENPLDALEARLLGELLERCGWRMQEAAERLGVSRVTLWRKLRDHGISRK